MLHKAEDKRRLAKKIEKHLSSAAEVRPFPAAVARLTAACQDPNACSKTFEPIISCDPALSVKVLRVARSPLYCPQGGVKTIPHAVSLLGLRKLKSVGMSVAGAAMFASGATAQQRRQALWQHSVGCAVVAGRIAEYVPGVDPDDAFLGGIFHDIGKLLFYDAIPEEYAELDESMSGLQLIREEEFLFGRTHEQIGLASAVSWQLPDEVKAAVGWHHRPEEAEFCADYARVVGTADYLSKHWAIGSDEVPNTSEVDEMMRHLGVIAQHLERLEAVSRSDYEEAMDS